MRNIFESHEVVKGIRSRIVVLGRGFLWDHLLLLHHDRRLLLLLHHDRWLLLSGKLLLDVWLLSDALSSVGASEIEQLSGIHLLGWLARRIDRLDLGKDVIDGALGLFLLSRHGLSICCVKVHSAELLIDVFRGGWHREWVVCEDLWCSLLSWLDLDATRKDHSWRVLVEK